MEEDTAKTSEQKMWEQLKMSPDVLKDYYYGFGNRWIGRNQAKLIALTGLTERQINDTLKAYRFKDFSDGVELSAPQVTPEQKRILMEAFVDQNYVDSERITELAKKTGLSRQQIAAWFSWERSIRDGTVFTKRKMVETSCDEDSVPDDPKSKKLYFSIENILSDDFPQKKK